MEKNNVNLLETDNWGRRLFKLRERKCHYESRLSFLNNCKNLRIIPNGFQIKSETTVYIYISCICNFYKKIMILLNFQMIPSLFYSCHFCCLYFCCCLW